MQQEDGGFESGTGREIDQARWRLWFARMRETGAVRAAGGFVVDPERAEECIADLSRIAEDVRLVLVTMRQLRFDPPGFDEVSVNVARSAAIMATSAESFVAAWANQIEAAREALSRQLEAYLSTDESNAGRRA